MEVVPTQADLFISQHQYIRDMLSRSNMTDAKQISTPLSTSTNLNFANGTASFGSYEFRSVIGELQYLSLTRPDISFSVNELSQFMHKLTITHSVAAKRLLRYLKQTIFQGIHIKRQFGFN